MLGLTIEIVGGFIEEDDGLGGESVGGDFAGGGRHGLLIGILKGWTGRWAAGVRGSGEGEGDGGSGNA